MTVRSGRQDPHRYEGGLPMLECVINVSEGRDPAVIATLAGEAGRCLLDVHRDGAHHRSVFTLAGPADELDDGVRRLAAATVAALDMRHHHGAHPRIGALDVVPWVALTPAVAPSGAPGASEVSGALVDGPLGEAVAARDRFARWAGAALSLPCFLYGPERSLPDVRRLAWTELRPDTGPTTPHPTAGASAVGARPSLVAYNLWLAQPELALARQIAADLRGPWLRTLGLAVGDRVQVSCNLIAPAIVGPAAVFDAVAERTEVAGAELVGLLPAAVLARIPSHRYGELDVSASRPIAARLEEAGLDGGRFDG